MSSSNTHLWDQQPRPSLTLLPASWSTEDSLSQLPSRYSSSYNSRELGQKQYCKDVILLKSTKLISLDIDWAPKPIH